MAKDIVRTRASITNFYKMRSQMQSVSTQMMVCINSSNLFIYINTILYHLDYAISAINVQGHGKYYNEYEDNESTNESASFTENDGRI